MQWYYVKDGARTGPVSEADFAAQVAAGQITDQTLVWNETMKDWQPCGAVYSRPESATHATICSMCGKQTAEQDLIAFEGSLVCAACKPKFVQQIKENSEISGLAVMRYAGFWIRFGAAFIDGIIIYAVNFPLGMLFGFLMPTLVHAQKTPSDALFFPAIILMNLLQMILPALYVIWMTGKYGATLGKKAVGIKVVMSDGSPISYGRATGRYFAKILSALILYIGYIMGAFDDEKRALHDHICNTRVIYK